MSAAQARPRAVIGGGSGYIGSAIGRALRAVATGYVREYEASRRAGG